VYRTGGQQPQQQQQNRQLHQAANSDATAVEALFKVTSVTGHVYNVDFVSGYDDWEATDPAALFGAKTVKTPAGGAAVPSHLQLCATGADVLILWLDCDREGENICFEVLHNTAPWLNAPDHTLVTAQSQVRRAVFSSVADEDVRRAMAGLRAPDKNLALAVDARQELDLKMGTAFTRLQSLYFKGRYADLGTKVVSYGPCLTPTLGFVVDRHDQISRFVSEEFWALAASTPAAAAAGAAAAAAGSAPGGRAGVLCQLKSAATGVAHTDIAETDAEANPEDCSEGSQQPQQHQQQQQRLHDGQVSLQWERCRVFSRPLAHALLSNCLDGVPYPGDDGALIGVVMAVTTTPFTRARPAPLNTVALLKAASRGLGLSPADAMHAAESLYIDGLITYPRTETAAYAASFDADAVLRAHTLHPEWGHLAAGVLATPPAERARPRRGTDAGDHPPITPAACVRPSSLSGPRARVYDYVCRHFLATVMPDCAGETAEARIRVEPGAGSRVGPAGSRECATGLCTGADVRTAAATAATSAAATEPDSSGASACTDACAGADLCEYFTLSATTVTTPGFTSAMPWLRPREAPYTITATAGARVPVCGLRISAGMTAPPGALSEVELMSLMEAHGIGTDATIPVHISNLARRGVAGPGPGPGRTLVPTPLGTALVHGYRAVDAELVLPTMRARVERQLGLIAAGDVDYKLVVEHILRVYRAKFAYFTQHIARMDARFSVRFAPSNAAARAAAAAELFTACGKCARGMRLFSETKPPRLFCEGCGDIYLLPGHGSLKKFPAQKCPYDGFELIYFTTNGSDPVSYPLCPCCYTRAPAPGAGPEMTCDRCRHPTCPQSQLARGVRPCPNAAQCGGVLVLHTLSRPRWRLGCSHCNYQLRLATGAHKVRLLKDGEVSRAFEREMMLEYARPAAFAAPGGGAGKATAATAAAGGGVWKSAAAAVAAPFTVAPAVKGRKQSAPATITTGVAAPTAAHLAAAGILKLPSSRPVVPPQLQQPPSRPSGQPTAPGTQAAGRHGLTFALGSSGEPADIESLGELLGDRSLHAPPPPPPAVCPFCSSSLFHIEAHKDAPLYAQVAPPTASGGASSSNSSSDGVVYRGCLFCDPILAGTARAVYGNSELDDGRGSGGVANRAREERGRAQRAGERAAAAEEREDRMRAQRDAVEVGHSTHGERL
jgi:DNA topoisomerase IA